MRVWLIYTALFLTGLALFACMLNASSNPETIILGEWKELKWEYEKVNKTGSDTLRKYNSEETQYLAGQHLVIHQAEKWTFLPGGRLRLTGNSQDKIVSWRIKGRGHILELKYDNDMKEHYNLTQLNEREMILNFESDIQVRGVAKLTFEKIL